MGIPGNSSSDVFEGFDGVKNKSLKKPRGISDDVSIEIGDEKLNSIPSRDEISLE